LRDQAHFAWDVVPFPQGDKGSVVGIDASGYAIARETAHPQAAWQLVAFLSSRQAQQSFAKSGLIVPARQDVAWSDDFLQAPPQHGQVFLDAMATGRPTHVPSNWNEIAETLTLALEPVWDGTQSAQAALTSVAPQIDRLLHEE
jgi:multiple sugar transport system substrate-binding protein